MVYAKSLLLFVFVFIAALAASSTRAFAASNPCTVTPNGSGGWNVNCASNPPTVINPLQEIFNGSPDPASGGHVGTVVVSPGDGDNGNPGQDATLDLFPPSAGVQAIEDNGTASYGVFVQSKGANGGSGGDADVCACGGGNGGSGGAGGNLTVTIEPTLTVFTNAFNEPGIFVQSAGGNGGNGGDGNGAASAGDGGVGGVGGTVSLTVFSSVITVGANSDGVIAQSIGGGGGSGGGGLNFSGGSGGPSENGGDVTLNLGDVNGGKPADIATFGDNSVGLLAQSIGGYGGVGGSSFGLVSVSGGGGNGGNGGTVNVNTSFDSSILTFGNGSTGLIAESIGGAGGSGGDGGALFFGSGGSGSVGGNGGIVNVNNGASITTNGAGAIGLLAQSIGGGGGNGGAGVGIVGLGGSGSSTSPGGNVSVVNTGNITTNSFSALSGGNNPLFSNGAIFAQSIGGGGGNGGTGVGLFSVGGSGGGGGDAGTVSVNNNATLITHASDSNGIFAQSIGGGGGNGGGSVAASAFVSLSIGGDAGVGGNGATTSVISNGTISTSGDRSNGIFAQSIGGGGGNGGFSIDAAGGQVGFAIAVGGQGGGGGTGGNVSVTGGTNITTDGNNANGILAQSIGGGGGNGGFAIAASGGIAAASFALGGSGSVGGASGNVTVGNSALGIITTNGDDSDGILAQSIGGGGGNGGFSVSAAVGAGSAGLAVGGEGAGGGDAGTVMLTNAASISTNGTQSDALAAQSIGGGGGNGGFSVGASASLDAGAGLSIGGFGAGGGNGDTVTLNNSGTLATIGDQSVGLLAQSVGGGGGNGGFSIAGALSAGPAAAIGIGGFGGGGGNGGTVNVTNSAAITTFGSKADALSAESIGGGGGNGGWTVAGSFGAESGAVSLGIGGFGGGGGNGGDVSVLNGSNSIFTYGANSNGIDAQSIGGGGGNGGWDVSGSISGGGALSLGLGGFGGGGGTGGGVDVTNTSNITTGTNGTANYANDILAQSIGGGGGTGGFSVAGTLSEGIAGDFNLGGFGGSGGDSGNVSVNNSGLLSSNGDFAAGINAQSIGGGGGAGGFAFAGALANDSSATLGLGGNGGTAGNAGTVSVTNTNDISTFGGSYANGILAQSIGGGGGLGGWSAAFGFSNSGVQLADSFGGNGGGAGSGNTVTVNSGTVGAPVVIITHGAASDGILAQSIGGGGGDGGITVNVSATGDSDGEPDNAKYAMQAINLGYGIVSAAVCPKCPGSSGGDANDAGAVNVTSYTNIETHGDHSTAIAAQSVGGGGGAGAITVGGAIDKTGPSVQMQFGSGGGGGNGGDVTVFSSGTLLTHGSNADGILAQSIGGGGGFGGLSGTNGLIGTGLGKLGISFGLSGDQGGDGGKVSVTNASSISTDRDNSNGIVAQSIGGGGGNGGFAIQGGFSLESGTPNSIFNYALGSFGGAGGNGGEVDVNSSASVIQTLGSRADGILAQSIGGGGGNGGFAINGAYTPGWAMGFSVGGSGGSSGNSGKVSVTNASQIATSGDLSNGISAQSIGGGGGNGGFAFEGLGSTGFTATLAVGGSSAGGGNGNEVDVFNTGAIGTLGAGADAILAQSIGGGGGNGGAAIAGSIAPGSSGAALSFGASGGAGGFGSDVNVTNQAQLITVGDNSADIAAQSIGGGGGNGGFSIGAGLTGGKSLTLSMGGNGGSGGSSSQVVVNNSASLLMSSGNNADGILAQSIGGGGGNGGFSIGATAALGKYNLGLAFGGNGGTGGTGGVVSVNNGSTNGTVKILTSGAFADGILAQSIGGGGGNGGWTVDGMGDNGASLAFSLGGSGGSGNDANNVIVNNGAGTIVQTTGMGANGIVAQAIGAGGGSGGFNEAGQLDLASGGITAASKFNFGNGGGGGNGANVEIFNAGQVFTSGDNAIGLLAQSIGGGGGYGGFSYGTALLGNYGIGLGSSTAGGGNGTAVTIDNEGTVATSGSNAAAVVAQSIGGGGGNGGFAWSAGLNSNISSPTANVGWALGSNGGNGGSGGLVTVTNNGIISTTGVNSAGVIAQSIGGGGGNGGNATTALASATQYFEGFNLALGGNAGSTGAGGTVNVTNNGVIQTTGAFSDGVIAQSIGGGGGNGGSATSVIAIVGLDESLAYGGAGGSGGGGGDVTVNNSGSIITTGFGSAPIVAQSIGGGGGTGGSMVSGSPFTGGLFGFKLGGTSGGTGRSGTVTINNTGTLSSGGMFSGDMLVQSVGGGGGILSSALLDSLTTKMQGMMLLGATGGTPGGGTAVDATNSGQLTTNALGADAFVAQSVGGGGGIGGSDIALNVTDTTIGGLSFGESGVAGAAGNGAAAALSQDNIAATGGDASDALLAQSISAGGGSGVLAIGGTFSAPSLALNLGTSIADLGGVGIVNATATSNVQMQTLGFHSAALTAQSIAGGGGVGTILIGGNVSGTSKIGYTLGATGTGSSNTGGTGATVTVSNSATKTITQGDLSTAILAQSIGGGGGDAAFKLGGTISNAALSALLGGSQLTAGTGGAVNVTNNGYVGDAGNGSLGVLAQSIGGGGGIGGFDNVHGTLPSVLYALGGTNDSNTAGGAVQFTNTGQIVTTGIGDAAAVAQSIGGGGGEEGYALNLNLGTAATTLNLLAGGTGGSNDIGGAVTYSNNAQIATGGNLSPDLLAQSIGGGGGNGGMFAAGNLTTSGSANQFKLQLGGSGGTGNDAGAVQLTSTVTTGPSTAAYIANGDQSSALVAQSIGGGGGNASLSFNGAFSTGTPNTALVQIGGTKAGNGNTVAMSNTGSIATGLHTAPGVIEGMFSDGLVGQSIGGGGGNGVLYMDLGVPTGAASVGTIAVNVGGKAGANGNGAAVNITNSAKIQTIGHGAVGIVAQSIGGGGGNGAAVIVGNKTAPPPTQAQYKLNINVGGVGSVGNGGDVTVTNSAAIITQGNSGPSILAQSIGGGGGTGGPVRSFIESHPTQCFTAVPPCSARLVGATITLGGNGSSGSGGTVTVNNKANLGTGGQDASGIIAQSIGGGGGIAGDAHAGHGDWDIVPNDVPGATLKNWGITLGGSHSTGNGGNVFVTDSGSISTQGDGSFGIIAQSIGGGGGIGGLGLGPQYGGSGSILIGGASSSSGNGGAVNVTVNNSATGTTVISTQGNGAYGIVAQSIGGGGGFMGEISPGVNKTVIGKGSKLVSTGGSGGNGGTVTVVNNGAIKTTGVGAEGIFAQSIGGGGGLLPGFAGTANLGGVASAVSVTQNGVIETLGNNADAIFAQSAGGKGAAGNVTVNVTGLALAYGANADGVTAQSVGNNGNGNISVTVNSNSVVQGGTGNGSAGVRFLNGKNNSLVNKGTITTASAANAVSQPMSLYEMGTAIEGVQSAAGGSRHTTSLMTDKTSLLSTFTGSTASSAGTAVYANAGTLNVNNQGNIYGSLTTSGANLHFTNSGTFVSGSQLNLGTGTMSLATGGVMAAGAGGFVATTDILGNFIEQTGSDYLVTLDLTNGTASLLNITGTASLGGSIDLDLLSTNAAAPGAHSDTIVTAGGGLTNNGAALTPPKSAVATFDLNYLPNALQLDYDVNYAPTTGRTLSVNDLSFGNYIGAIQTAGSTPALESFMSDVFAVPTIPKLKTFYDRFTPGASVALGSSALLGNLQFSNDMLRCHSDGVVTQSGNCNWARLGTESSHESGTFSSVGYGRSANGFAYGFEHRIGNGTSIGAAIHYTRSNLFDSDAATSLTGNGLEAGITASRMRHDGILLSADVLGGEGHYNSARQIGYPALVTTASGSQAISYIGTHLRAEKRFGGNLRAVTPFFDAGLTRVNVGALFESGAGTMNENVAPYHAIYPTISSGVRLEDSKLFHGSMLHGTLDLSLTQLVGNPQTMTTATLQSAPEGVAPFAVTNTLDRSQFNVGPALDITRGTKTNIRIGASYSFSKHTHTGGAYIQFKLTP